MSTENRTDEVQETDERGSRDASSAEQLGVALLIIVLVLGVFGQTLGHGFLNFDDDAYVTENPLVRSGLSLDGIAAAFETVHTFTWHPVTTISHMLDCELWGVNPFGHHLTNVLLHAATAVLLFFVLLRMTGAYGRSAFVALVFAVHPLRVESVAWISERKDVLSGLFFVLTLGAYDVYARERQETGRFPVGRYLVLLAYFALAILSKPMAVTLPFVLLLLDAWPLARWRGTHAPARRLGALVLEKLPLFALSAGCIMATLRTQAGAMSSTEALSIGERIGNALVSYTVYLRQLFWPLDLAIVVPHRRELPVAEVAFAALLLVGISAFVWLRRRKHPALPVGWLWYLGMLVPVIGLVQVGVQAHADRYTYLPHIGLLVMVSWGLAAARPVRALGARNAALLGLAATLVLAGLAAVQASRWKSSESVWRQALACTEENSVAHAQLGVALERSGQIEEAVQHYRAAIAIQPDYATPRYNLGNYLASRGDTNGAIEQYRLAVEARPGYAKAYNNLGAVLSARGRTTEALDAFAHAVEAGHSRARLNLAGTLLSAGHLNEAAQQYSQLVREQPGNASARIGLGSVLVRQGKLDEGIAAYREALLVDPQLAEGHGMLGIALATQGDIKGALEHLERAAELEPDSPTRQDNLATALGQIGDHARAEAHMRRAIELADARGDAQMGGVLRARLQALIESRGD